MLQASTDDLDRDQNFVQDQCCFWLNCRPKMTLTVSETFPSSTCITGFLKILNRITLLRIKLLL